MPNGIFFLDVPVSYTHLDVYKRQAQGIFVNFLNVQRTSRKKIPFGIAQILSLIHISNLPGQKILLRGNHDYWWSTVAKMEKVLAKEKICLLYTSRCV